MRKICIIFLTLLTIAVNFTYAQKRDKRTPFAKVEYRNNHPYIQYRGEWVKLLGIEGKPVSDYLEMAQQMEPADWKFGFHRYLHYIMDEMKMERGKTVEVSFEQDGRTITRDFELKKENRDLATKFHDRKIGEYRVERKHSKRVPQKWKYLTTRLDGEEPTVKDWLSPEEATHDLEHLEWQIVNNYSYAELTGFDYKKGIDAIAADLKEGISKRDFALQLKLFMANFGDGHSRVSMGRYVIPKEERNKWLPFDIIKHGEKFYGKDISSNEFYSKEYKQVTAINGVSMQQLYKIAEQFVPKTTPKFVERNSVEYLFFIKFLLKLAGAEPSDSVTVTFSDGTKTRQEVVKLDRYKWNRPSNRYLFRKEVLDGNIGYLAMNEHMESADEFIDSLHHAMQDFRHTDGLIIDIRGNGGGSRAPLLALLPYLVQKPVIANVARYRVDREKDIHPKNGYLIQRYSWPENYAGYTPEERAAIAHCKQSFEPVRRVSDRKFSQYHYMVVSPTTDKGTYYYGKPVIVLVDSGCFSASDIFAAGIRQGDQVRLLGVTTGGGSGFSKSRRLPNSRIKVKLSRMFSYQPDGQLYDGHGVIPDIPMDYTLEDQMGATDSQLEKACSILRGK
ncbi:MAG: S41 family peptidase [Marinifilaceae bacterium]